MFKYLVLGLVFMLGARADSCRPERCPPDGNLVFPYNSTCSSFITCINGTPILRNCPDGEIFDKNSKVCLPADVAKCGCKNKKENIRKYKKNFAAPYVAKFKALREYEGAVTNISQRCYENSVTPVICQSDIGDDRLMVHPDDCRLFYVCESIGQKPVCRDCPANLHFNPTLKVCDHPWNAGCMSHLVRPLPLPIEEKRAFQPIPYKFPGLTKEDFNTAYEKIEQSADNTQCIQNNETNADLRPDPQDCSKYYVCDSGYLISMSCPEGLHFSTIFKVCDLPQNARCQQNSTSAYVQKVVALKDAVQSIPYKMPELQPEINTTYKKHIEFRADNNQCVQSSGPNADLRPDPQDCSKYFVCDGGYLISMSCPEDLHYNTALKVCDLPENARCQQNAITPHEIKTIILNQKFKHIPFKMPQPESGVYWRAIQPKAVTQCVQDNGPYADLRPDPQDCSKYFVCDGGYLISMSCPEDLHYNAALKVCDLPENARCQQNAITPHEIKTNILKQKFKHIPFKMPQPESGVYWRAIQPKAGTQCVQDNGPYADLRPDPQDCSKYFVCDVGYLISMSCPEDLHYNTALKVCDLPKNARCQQNATTPHEIKTIILNQKFKHIPFKMPQPESGVYWRAIQPKAVTQCVQDNGPYADLRPDPQDCSKYFVCDGGYLISMSCPEDLHYNAALKVCDLPENARCQQNAITPHEIKTNILKQKFKHIPFKMPQPESGVYWRAIQPKAGTQCVQDNGPYADLRPDPQDCSKYFVCDVGYLISMSCPEDLHYNTALKVCDLPRNARCQQNATTPHEIKTIILNQKFKHIPFKMPLPESGVYWRAIQPKAGTQCVQDNGPYADLRPDPQDCSKYFVCDVGYLISMSCPEDLHYNTALKVCDLPKNARCQQNATTPHEIKTIILNQKFKHIPFKMPQPESGVYWRAIQPKAGTQCVQDNGPYADLRPDPQDCGRYFVCDNGYLISMACPDGLHFSTMFKVCDLPQNARCQQNATETYKSEDRNPKNLQVSYGLGKFEKMVPPKEIVIECNAQNGPLGGWADLRPDIEDCTKYYVCDRGTVHSMNCPDGLHFSTASKVCDYPERAQCQVVKSSDSVEDSDESEKRDSYEERDNSEENSDSQEVS